MNAPLEPDTGALPKSVVSGAGQGGLPRLEIATPAATAQAYLHGAHLTHWQPSHAQAPVLWMSEHSAWQDGKPIRGGVPICFPWFGPHRSEPSAAAHGFARLVDWTLAGAVERDDQSVAVTFALEGARVSELWPFRFRATYEIAVGPALTMSLEVENRDDTEFSFEEALHTYFAVSGIADVTIAGLERTPYLDKVGGLAPRPQDDTPIRFTGETDRVYLETMACLCDRRPGPAAPYHREQGQLAFDGRLESLDRQGARDGGFRRRRVARHGLRRDGKRGSCRRTACARRAPSHDGVSGRRVALIGYLAVTVPGGEWS